MQEITDVTNNPLLLNPQFSSQATSYQQHFLSWLPRCHPSLTRSCVTIAPFPSFLLVPFPLPSILGWLVPQFLIPSLLMTPRYVSLTHTSPELQTQLAISTWISSRHLQLSLKLIFGSFPGKKKKSPIHLQSSSSQLPATSMCSVAQDKNLCQSWFLFPQPHHQFIW